MTTGTARLVGLDVARCLALVGMIATHTYVDRTPEGDLTLVQAVAGGRSSALFAVLAGVGIALATRERATTGAPLGASGAARAARGRERLALSSGIVVRALLVGFLGLVLGGLESGLAVILTSYAVLFVLLLPFVGPRAPVLFALAGLWAVVAPVGSHLVRPSLPPRGFDSPSLSQLGEPVRLLSELTVTGYYPALTWLAYGLLGLAVGRCDLAGRVVPAVLALVGAALVVVVPLVSAWLVGAPGVVATLAGRPGGPDTAFDATTVDRLAEQLSGTTPTGGPWQWLLVTGQHSGTPADLLQTQGSALLVIGSALLLAGAVGATGRRVLAVGAGAGSMTLSLYSLHVVARQPDVWPPDDGTEAWVWHTLLVLALGAAFAAAGRRGPLEAVVSRASRGAADAVRRPSRR